MKTEKMFGKAVIIIFLVLLVLGFVIPGVINYNTSDAAAVEPRLCSSDADCYLFCDDLPAPVLCSQNMCARNSCDEASYYEYNAVPITFTLHLENVTLEDRGNDRDLFVKFEDGEVQLFSSRLILYQILEKAGIIFDSECLTLDGKQFCGEKLKLKLNGKNSTLYRNYAPKEGDLVEIIYS